MPPDNFVISSSRNTNHRGICNERKSPSKGGYDEMTKLNYPIYSILYFVCFHTLTDFISALISSNGYLDEIDENKNFRVVGCVWGFVQ